MRNSTKFLTAVSAVALLFAAPAHADQANMDKTSHTSQYGQQLDPNVVRDRDGDVDYPNRETVRINKSMTAEGMIGMDIQNMNGEAVASISDIIVNENGEAQMFVLSNNEWTNMGKMVTLEYSSITNPTPNGNIMTDISENDIENAPEFTYEQMPANMFSVSALLDAYLTDTQNEQVADVTNISFNNGKADKLVVDVDENLSVTSHQVAMDFNSIRLMKNEDGEPEFKLSASQAQTFKNIKQSL